MVHVTIFGTDRSILATSTAVGSVRDEVTGHIVMHVTRAGEIGRYEVATGDGCVVTYPAANVDTKGFKHLYKGDIFLCEAMHVTNERGESLNLLDGKKIEAPTRTIYGKN
jgi:hypothetical protein